MQVLAFLPIPSLACAVRLYARPPHAVVVAAAARPACSGGVAAKRASPKHASLRFAFQVSALQLSLSQRYVHFIFLYFIIFHGIVADNLLIIPCFIFRAGISCCMSCRLSHVPVVVLRFALRQFAHPAFS